MSEQTAQKHHALTITGRQKAAVSGVEEVVSCDNDIAVLATPLGRLVLRGVNLRINSFDLSRGNLELEGQIDSLEYLGRQKQDGSLWSRLMR